MKRLIFLLTWLLPVTVFAQDTWMGLTISPENRCSPFDREEQYPYSQSVEDAVIASMNGKIYGPYTGRYFDSKRDTDIEHIVSVSEIHDIGLCAASDEVRRQFANDVLNLTLAAPEVNRCYRGGKCGYDAGEWLPERNKCWFANRVVQVKRKYNATVDMKEARALSAVLSQCESTEMVYFASGGERQSLEQALQPDAAVQSPNALAVYDSNGNGRITCKEAREHGIAPVRRTHPAYRYMQDRDGDGIVCE